MNKFEKVFTVSVAVAIAFITAQTAVLFAQTGIGTKQIKDSAITSPKIAAGAVTPDKLDESYYTETEVDAALDDKVDSDSAAYTGVVEHKATEDALNGLVSVDGAGNYSAVTDNSTDWNTAYGWGDHAGLYDDTGIGTAIMQGHLGLYNHDHYDTAYGWGNHAGLYSFLGHTHFLGDITDYDTTFAEDIRTDTTNFDGNLSGTDTTLQAALETLDELASGGDMLKATYDLDDSGKVDTAEDLSIPGQAAGDVLYCDGSRWNRLAKDIGKFLKSGDFAPTWDTPAGSGDMTKAVYDLNEDSRVDTAEVLSDGANTSSAADVKDAVDKKHVRDHGIDSTDDHDGVSGATEDNFISFNASGLPKDSGKSDASYADASHTHTASDVTNIDSEINQVYRQVLSVSASTETSLYLYGGARVNIYDITASGNIQADTVLYNDGIFPKDGDNLIIRFKANSAPRTLTLRQNEDGTFLYGSSVTSGDLTQTETDRTDYVGCQWFATLKRWCVMAISKGFHVTLPD